jgi:predicted TIM-barrel fold metal-dependent hydrolase
MSNCRRIDAHTHIVPPDYRKWLLAKGLDAGGSPVPEWSLEAALENMEANEIETAILSLSTPGVQPAKRRQARSIARDLNEHSAEVVRGNAQRFGFLATLTLPDIDGALAEAAHAFDKLGADGVVLPGHAGGVYLGDPKFDPRSYGVSCWYAPWPSAPSSHVRGFVCSAEASRPRRQPR